MAALKAYIVEETDNAAVAVCPEWDTMAAGKNRAEALDLLKAVTAREIYNTNSGFDFVPHLEDFDVADE